MLHIEHKLKIKGKEVSENRSNQWLFAIVGIVIAAIFLVSIYIGYLLLTTPDNSESEFDIVVGSDGVTVIEPPQAMPDFTLTSQSNETIQLSDLGGQLVLMSFGFTHCPDVCPTTLGDMRSIHEKLGEQADNVHFVFMSVDGERDTPKVLAEYFQTHRVDTFLIGMTGSEEDVRAAIEPYGGEFLLGEPDDFGNYQVQHTAGMFLLDRDRNWIRRYTFGTSITRIVEDLQDVIN